jgi:hypothetical protein
LCKISCSVKVTLPLCLLNIFCTVKVTPDICCSVRVPISHCVYNVATKEWRGAMWHYTYRDSSLEDVQPKHQWVSSLIIVWCPPQLLQGFHPNYLRTSIELLQGSTPTTAGCPLQQLQGVHSDYSRVFTPTIAVCSP